MIFVMGAKPQIFGHKDWLIFVGFVEFNRKKLVTQNNKSFFHLKILDDNNAFGFKHTTVSKIY